MLRPAQAGSTGIPLGLRGTSCCKGHGEGTDASSYRASY